MTGTPFYSIVSITYQNLAGLEETVASVRAQAYGDYEHIVVDGGSRDGTVEWLQSNFAGTWVSEPDGGRYPAMNKGARMARGTYIWFLHAGDTLGDPGVLGRVAEAFRDGPEWGYGLARVVSADKELVGTLGFAPFRLFNFAILGQALPHQATVMSRELLERLGGYAETMPVAADQLLLLRAAHASPPLAMADFLCDFDSTGISAGRRWWIDYWDAERNRRQLGHPVTRWQALDTVLSFSYASVRQITRTGRALLSRATS